MNILIRPLATLVLVALVRLSAQEVIVGELGWFRNDGVPDQPPQAKRPLKPEYPRELRSADAGEGGYVILTRYLDAKGQSLDLEVNSANPRFAEAVMAALEDWQLLPAKRGGQAVPSWFWMPIIFNPKSASPDQPEATPRLLAVTPVIVPPAMMRKIEGDGMIWGRVTIDAAGDPQKVILEPGVSDRLLPFVESALRQWRFAPARRGGQPIAADLRLAFLACPSMAPVPTTWKPPRVLPSSQKPPTYPFSMEKSGIEGQVLLAFVVDREGAVRDPVVVRSNNPAFDVPAVECVLKWKFEPSTVDNQPVNARMTVPIVFQFDNSRGREAYSVDSPSRKAKQQIPEKLRYDVNPKLRGIVNPVFPYAPLRNDQQGKAIVLLAVSPAGAVVQTKVVEATLPEFGLALAAAAETFEFDPALKDGHPIPAALRFEQEFGPHAENRIVTNDDLSLLKREKKKPESIINANKLDVPLKPLSRRPPVFPLALRGKVDKGEAVIELLVDEEGRVRLPRIVEASDPAFGYAAVQAVAQWLFTHPQSNGKVAVVRVRVPFSFELKPPAMGRAAGEPAAHGDAKQNPETTR
jgi:TonB family protein